MSQFEIATPRVLNRAPARRKLWRVAVWFAWQWPHALVREANGAWRMHGPRGRRRIGWKLTMATSWALAAARPLEGPGRWGHSCHRRAIVWWWDPVFHGLRRAGLVALAWIWPTGAGWRRRLPAGSVAALFMGLTAVAAPNPVQPGEGELHAAPSTHAGGAPGGGLMGETDLANAAGDTLGLGAGTTDRAFSDAPGSGASGSGKGSDPKSDSGAAPNPAQQLANFTGPSTGDDTSGGEGPDAPTLEVADSGVPPTMDPALSGRAGGGANPPTNMLGGGVGGGGSGGGGDGGVTPGPTDDRPSMTPSDPGSGGPVLVDMPLQQPTFGDPGGDDPFMPGDPGDPFNPAPGGPTLLGPIDGPGGGDPDRGPLLTEIRDQGGVPEPATWMAMILGLCAVGAILRRRRGPVALQD